MRFSDGLSAAPEVEEEWRDPKRSSNEYAQIEIGHSGFPGNSPMSSVLRKEHVQKVETRLVTKNNIKCRRLIRSCKGNVRNAEPALSDKY